MTITTADIDSDPLLKTPSDGFNEERERIHRQMLSSVSHDLKTPLASIIGSLEVFERMKDKLPEDKKNSLIEVALQEAYRLDNFITNILDMAKMENGMVKVRRESAEIGGLIRSCLLRLSNRLRGSTVDLEAVDGFEIMTDPVLLSRAVCLVLDNAVKYGGKPPSIAINFGRSNGDSEAFIAVTDNGSGIPEAQHEAVFSKYTRFAKEDQQNAGTGLGLSICRAIMTLLGGTVDLAQKPSGQGATFTLRFPIS